jgi:hypothetical protein
MHKWTDLRPETSDRIIESGQFEDSRSRHRLMCVAESSISITDGDVVVVRKLVVAMGSRNAGTVIAAALATLSSPAIGAASSAGVSQIFRGGETTQGSQIGKGEYSQYQRRDPPVRSPESRGKRRVAGGPENLMYCWLSTLNYFRVITVRNVSLRSRCKITLRFGLISRTVNVRSHQVNSHLYSLPVRLLHSLAAEIFLRCRHQILLAKQSALSPRESGLKQHSYRIEAILEAVTARDIRIVLLQARKALAPEQFIIHTRAGSLRELAKVIFEV